MSAGETPRPAPRDRGPDPGRGPDRDRDRDRDRGPDRDRDRDRGPDRDRDRDRGPRDRDRDRGPQSVKSRLRAKARKKARKQARRMFTRRKVCRFCADANLKIDFRDPRGLKFFVTETGKMIPRRISGNCARHQRMVQAAIKRSRHIALMPYSSTQG